MATSFLAKVGNLLQPKPPSATTVVSVTGTDSYAELPQGFFRCRAASGKESLGWNGGFLAWDVGQTVVDGGRRITLDKPKSELPIVNLNFQKQTDGVQQIGNTGIVDTDALEPDNGAVSWDGQKPRDGVAWV